MARLWKGRARGANPLGVVPTRTVFARKRGDATISTPMRDTKRGVTTDKKAAGQGTGEGPADWGGSYRKKRGS